MAEVKPGTWGSNRVAYEAVGVELDFGELGVTLAQEHRLLLSVEDADGTPLLQVPEGSYMVVADGWRGAILHRLARALYWRKRNPQSEATAPGLVLTAEGGDVVR